MIKDQNNTYYYKDGKLVKEHTENHWGILLLYRSWFGWILRLLVTQPWVGKFVGWYYQKSFSARGIKKFITRHHLIMDDFVVPVNGYQSFNDFFIRRLKPGARVIAQGDEAFLAPADSKLLVFPVIRDSMTFFVKHLPFNLERLLNNSILAKSYHGGSMAVFRLAPYDYHRFHFPIDGVLGQPIEIEGGYDSVNPVVYKSGMQPLITNKRTIIPLHNDKFGRILMIPVGALFVASIIVTARAGSTVSKGDEAGYFQFGGSTVILLAEKGTINYKDMFIQNTQKGLETAVVVGENIGTIAEHKELL